MKHGSIPIARLTIAFTTAMSIPATTDARDLRADQPRHFAFINYGGSPKIDANEFIIEVTDTDVAERFAAMIQNRQLQPRVAFVGNIVAGRAPYNEGWAFHVDPASIRVGEAGHIEVCAATPEYVEEHLSDVGGSFLPGNFWCSWDMHVTREVLR